MAKKKKEKPSEIIETKFSDDKITVLIIGSVYDGKKYLNGKVELPKDEALNLVNSKYAVIVPKTIETKKAEIFTMEN